LILINILIDLFLLISSQEKYIDAASELIVYTYFFSASEEVVPEVIFKTILIMQFHFLNDLFKSDLL
jgi:hypothetical protein